MQMPGNSDSRVNLGLLMEAARRNEEAMASLMPRWWPTGVLPAIRGGELGAAVGVLGGQTKN
jgi:hypothetical protein